MDSQAVQGPQTSALAQPFCTSGLIFGTFKPFWGFSLQGTMEGRDLGVPRGTQEAQEQGTLSPYSKQQPGKSHCLFLLNQVPGKGQILVWLNSGYSTGVTRGVQMCARKDSCTCSRSVLTLEITICCLLQCTPKLIPI